MARLRKRFERFRMPGLLGGRTRKRQPSYVPLAVVEAVGRLKREVYPDCSVGHFREFAQRRFGVKLGYRWTKDILQAHGVVDKEASRGKYRRKRERRPMRGMMVHMDASTHPWLGGQPPRDLFVALDDADGRILHARFVEQEGTMATLQAIDHILRRWGRFCELYTDRGSHFAPTVRPGTEPAVGQVQRVPERVGFEPFPYHSMAIWILTQMRRWGQLQREVDYAAIASQVFLALDAGRAMRDLGLTVPANPMRNETILGRSFDPAQPDAYLNSFAIKR
jgi:hypothetical protein